MHPVKCNQRYLNLLGMYSEDKPLGNPYTVIKLLGHSSDGIYTQVLYLKSI